MLGNIYVPEMNTSNESSYHETSTKKISLQDLQLVRANQRVLKNSLILPKDEGAKYHFSIKRIHQGIKYFTPEYELVNQDDETILFAKKTGMFQFSFAMRRAEWALKSEAYIGRLVSNITGSILNFHLKVIIKQRIQERIVCSIEYTNGYLQFKQPRKIQVFMLDLSKVNISDRKYQNVSSLRQIYEKDLFESNIFYLQNKYPLYNKVDKIYTLDFHGRAPVCSVKNFILQHPAYKGRQYLLFGKKDENTYNLDFMHPFSSINAFAVALTSFNGKIICE